MNNANRMPVSFIVRGELTEEDLEFTLRFLGKQGLSSSFIKDESIIGKDFQNKTLSLVTHQENDRPLQGKVEIVPGPYPFTEINSVNQFLIREHVWEFRERFAPDYTREDAGKALSAILHPAVGPNQPTRDRKLIDPADIGLVVKERREVGFGAPPAQTYNVEAVQVGGFLNLVNDPDNFGMLYGINPRGKVFLEQMASLLQQQIDSATTEG
jgi:hypothetical protein